MALNKLISKARKGERKSQYKLYRYCFSHLMPICLRYRADRQEALSSLNAAFLKILNGLKKFESEEIFVHWCKRVTINTLIDEHRKYKNRPEHVSLDSISNGRSQQHGKNEVEGKLQAEDILLLLAKLPEPTRTVFNLFAMDGYAHAEIAEKLEMSEGTSKWHLHKARKMLIRMLPEYFQTEIVDGHEK